MQVPQEQRRASSLTVSLTARSYLKSNSLGNIKAGVGECFKAFLVLFEKKTYSFDNALVECHVVGSRAVTYSAMVTADAAHLAGHRGTL